MQLHVRIMYSKHTKQQTSL